MDDHDLARLLSGRAEPSVLEKEEVFERVHAKTRAAPRRWSRRVALAGAGAAAAAAAWLALPAAPPEFVGRGAGDRALHAAPPRS